MNSSLQRQYTYPAFFDPCDEGAGYTVTFPDLPGIVTEGDTLDEALFMAKEALTLHLSGMQADNDPIPTPSSPEALSTDSGAFFHSVTVTLP
jgi:predicted RNase H-like HicB family nuclease